MTAETSAPDSLPGFIGSAASTRAVVATARRAARHATSVLITGESGAGKSALARAMHEDARGPEAPLVVIDCASLPEGLAENELFGHEAGAYSGADTRQPGKFEAADRGTVVLDRVADLPPDVQGKLLRVVQERSFERVGGHSTVKVNVMIIATASEDLRELAARKLFREDLFYRLAVVAIEIPPLRERVEDIAPLASEFLDRISARSGRTVTLAPESLEVLQRWSWPGNVRELQNVLERAAALAPTDTLGREDIEPRLVSMSRAPGRAIDEIADAGLSLEDVEKLLIARVLERTGGRIGEAARQLGIHRKTLLEKRRRYGLP